MLFPIKSIFGRTFLTLIPFTLMISVLYTCLVSTAFHMSEDHVLQDYLQAEYQDFRKTVALNPDKVRLPSNSYLQSYWLGDPDIPGIFRGYPAGKHEIIIDDDQQNYHLLIAEIPELNRSICLILDEQKMSTISHYENMINSILYAVAALVILASAIVSIIIARLLAKPVTDLAEDVSRDWKPDKVFSGIDRQDEIGTLSRAFTGMVRELQNMIDREKSFSRHASHEIRTPLAIIRNSLAVLMLPNSSEEKRQRNLLRIREACESAEKTLDVFLSLGQKESTLKKQQCSVNALVASSLEQYRTIADASNINLQVNASENIQVSAPASLLEAVINNLIRNALSYGEDYLIIALSCDAIEFKNRINDTPITDGRYGYGLEIVQRISESLGWSFTTVIEQNEFTARLLFRETEAA